MGAAPGGGPWEAQRVEVRARARARRGMVGGNIVVGRTDAEVVRGGWRIVTILVVSTTRMLLSTFSS